MGEKTVFDRLYFKHFLNNWGGGYRVKSFSQSYSTTDVESEEEMGEAQVKMME